MFVEDGGYKLVATLVEGAVSYVKAENLLEGRENRSEVVPEVIQSCLFVIQIDGIEFLSAYSGANSSICASRASILFVHSSRYSG